jgi:hypothetical protein
MKLVFNTSFKGNWRSSFKAPARDGEPFGSMSLSGLPFKLKRGINLPFRRQNPHISLSLCINNYMNVGKLNIVISDELEEHSGKLLLLTGGKGVISKSLEEAIDLWIKSKSRSAIHEKSEISWNGKDQY